MAELADRMIALPGMDRLLEAIDDLPPAWLVGGAVRDLLRDADSVDIDVVIEGDAPAAARKMAERLGGSVTEHERFGTATVTAGDLTVDLATARRETYTHPGALPDVEAATLDEDLARRDFTINAMAASLAPLGGLVDPHGGYKDLQDGVIRVLHSQSFQDDPTRLLRAVRYETRLNARMDRETEQLAREAIGAGAPSTVSGSRIRDELLDLLAEPGAPESVKRMAELGLDRALHPALGDADPAVVEKARAAADTTGAQPRFAALGALIAADPEGLAAWVEDLHLRAEDRDAVLRAARKAPQLVQTLQAEMPPSALHAVLRCEQPEVLAYAIALGAPEEPIRRWRETLSAQRLEVTGDDLVAAGIPESPAIGRALAETLRRKLDGEVEGRDAELELALRLAREDQG